MVLTGISEFTFGFSFLFEQTQRNWAGLKAVPVLPSLQQEADYGWDAHLPLAAVDYYYQFKLSDYLKTSRASFWSDHKHPYYRIALHRRDRNRQHRRLKKLATRKPYTYYVAPELNDIGDFQASFLAREIVQHSRLIPVAECKAVYDREQHYISYCEGDPKWIFHSESETRDSSRTGREIEQIYRKSLEHAQRVDRTFAEQIFETTRDAIREDGELVGPERALLDRTPRSRAPGSLIRAAGELVSVYYGATMVLVGIPATVSERARDSH